VSPPLNHRVDNPSFCCRGGAGYFDSFFTGTIGESLRLGATKLLSAIAIRAQVTAFRAFEFTRGDGFHEWSTCMVHASRFPHLSQRA
jgi:hypothetical protein